MLGEVFYWLFNMSIAATVTGVCILLLRKIKKIPRQIICILWIIPFLRMWIPIGLGSKYGLMALISKVSERTVTIHSSVTSFPFTMMNHIAAADSYFPIIYKTNILKGVFGAASVIWVIFAAILITVFSATYIISVKQFRKAEHLKDNIFLSGETASPAVFGVIRPRIIIPFKYKGYDLHYVLLHENAHIKRCDNLFRIIALITVCIHWFNPFAWLFFKCLLNDIELACDESVLERCTDYEKKRYAHTLLDFAESKSVVTSAFGGAKIKTRINSILSYERITAVSFTAFVILIIAAAYILLTNPI